MGRLGVVDLADEGSVVGVVAEGEELRFAGLPVGDEPADIEVAVGELLGTGDVVRPEQGLCLATQTPPVVPTARSFDMSLARAENIRISCPSTCAV